MNLSPCNTCQDLSPSKPQERDGKVYLVKECARCGQTETLISSDARRYWAKREMGSEHEQQACDMQCLQCHHRQRATLVFVDVTNRCNMNCPICINNTPSMGFLFEPPLEYFEKIFKHFAAFDPSPAFQLFGGEPTAREDLVDILKLARKYRIRIRLVTNGLKLADEAYCREILKQNVTVLIAYDGDNPRMYEKLRGTAKVLEVKLKALETLRRLGAKKVTFMTLIAKDQNAHEIRGLLDFCHERRDMMRGIYLMPLAHTWKSDEWDYDPERITAEDLENLVNEAFPGEQIDFLPAGFLGDLPALRKCFRVNPRLPFLGAHPNCESVFLMYSDGQRYAPLSHLLKGSAYDALKALCEADARLIKRVESLEKSALGRLLSRVRLLNTALAVMGFFAFLPATRRYLRMGAVLRGKNVGKMYHAAMLLIERLLGLRNTRIQERHTVFQGFLQIVILPFEDRFNRETERLERCPSVFAYVDPKDGKVKTSPVCSWAMHKTEMMRAIAEQYGAPPDAPAA